MTKRTAALGLRVTPELKAMLARSAQFNGRTLSQEAVVWLDRGIRLEQADEARKLTDQARKA